MHSSLLDSLNGLKHKSTAEWDSSTIMSYSAQGLDVEQVIWAFAQGRALIRKNNAFPYVNGHYGIVLI